MRWLATVTVVSLCGPPSALAQSQDWLVLPATAQDDTAWMQPTVDSLSRELRTRGIGVWSREAAVDAFERRGSSPPAEVSAEQVRAWAEGSEQALRKLAMTERKEALDELEEAQAFSRSALEVLNRDPAGSQAVLDTCLYLVRARRANGDQRGAAEQAKECVRMVPSGQPSPRMHPPDVTALYARASESSERTGTLRVESDPSRCPLRLNGVLVGKTPIEVANLYPGSYRVNLECEPGRGGRVHRVVVSARSTSLFIFDRFDQAVGSEPLLHLAYDEPPSSARSAADARQVKRALPAPVVLVATRIDPDIVELRVVSTTRVETTVVRIPMTAEGPAESVLPDAVSALLAGRCVSLTGDEGVELDCVTGEPMRVSSSRKPAVEKTRSPVRPPRGQYLAGVTLASAGAASMLAAYGLVIARRSAGDDWLDSPNNIDPQSKWLSLGTGLLVTGSAGAALLVAGMPLALPYRPKTPWWAWMSGGLGVAATAGMIASVVTASPKPPQSCSVSGPDPGPCVARHRDTDRAFILGMTAAPLLTMPLVYLLRSNEKRLRTELAPTLVAGRGGGVVGVGGTF